MIDINLKKNYDQGPDGIIKAEEFNSIYSELKNIILTASNETNLSENNNFQLLKAIENIIERDSTEAVKNYYKKIKQEIIEENEKNKQETIKEVERIKNDLSKSFLNTDAFFSKLNFVNQIGKLEFKELKYTLTPSPHETVSKKLCYLNYFKSRDVFEDIIYIQPTEELQNFFMERQKKNEQIYFFLDKIYEEYTAGRSIFDYQSKGSFLRLNARTNEIVRITKETLLDAYVRNILPMHRHAFPNGPTSLLKGPTHWSDLTKRGSTTIRKSTYVSSKDKDEDEKAISSFKIARENEYPTSEVGTEIAGSEQNLTIRTHPKPKNINLAPILISDAILDFYGIDFNEEEFKRLKDIYSILDESSYNDYLECRNLRKEMYKVEPLYGQRMLKYMS